MKMHLLLALLITTQAAATSFYIRPFSEFTESTPNIIRGKLSGIHVENGVTSDGGKTIYTFANLGIKEVLKGNITGTQIIIRKIGGSKDGTTLEIPSSVEFTEKEEGVFFLSSEREDHSYEVTGMELGKFGIEQKDGDEILTGGIFSYSHVPSGVPRDPNVPDRLAENKKPWSITQLRNLIHTQAQSMPAIAETGKTTEISKSSVVAIKTPTPLDAPTENISSLSPEKENSPLYFSSGVWYFLATVALTLGVYFYWKRE